VNIIIAPYARRSKCRGEMVIKFKTFLQWLIVYYCMFLKL